MDEIVRIHSKFTNMYFVRKYPCLPWNKKRLSKNKNITIDVVNMHLPNSIGKWSYSHIEITLKDIKYTRRLVYKDVRSGIPFQTTLVPYYPKRPRAWYKSGEIPPLYNPVDTLLQRESRVTTFDTTFMTRNRICKSNASMNPNIKMEHINHKWKSSEGEWNWKILCMRLSRRDIYGLPLKVILRKELVYNPCLNLYDLLYFFKLGLPMCNPFTSVLSSYLDIIIKYSS